MATRPLYPAVGLSVPVPTATDSACPTSGYQAEIPLSDYLQGEVDAGRLLTYDPLDAGTTPTRDDFAYAIYVTDLVTRNGSYGGEVIAVIGYSSKGDGGEGLYWWDATSTTAQDYGTVCGNLTLGRWKRVYDGQAVDPAWFGAYGDNSTDDSAAIQAAINTGKDVDFRGRSYKCHGLTASTSFQKFVSTGGKAQLTKNANGVLFTCTASFCEWENIDFRGDASTPVYTGDNVSCTGNYLRFVNCHSVWAYGRAIKATGGPVRIYGGQWQTADLTASGYDIELGQSGAATLYHVIHGIGTAQSTGGILLVDTGASFISDSQFGKLRADPGASSAGSSSPKVANCRINGAISIGQSSFTATNCAIVVGITFDLGTSGCYVENSVFDGGSYVVNNGNANNLVVRQVSAGSYYEILYGADTSLAKLRITPNSGDFRFPETVTIANNKSLGFENLAGSRAMICAMSTGNVFEAYNTSGVFQVGGSGGFKHIANLLVYGTTGITAANPPAQGSSALTYDVNDVTTVANLNDSVTLPAAAANRVCWVINSGANTMQIYPASGDDCGGGVDTAITLASGSKAQFWAKNSTTWVRLV